MAAKIMTRPHVCRISFAKQDALVEPPDGALKFLDEGALKGAGVAIPNLGGTGVAAVLDIDEVVQAKVLGEVTRGRASQQDKCDGGGEDHEKHTHQMTTHAMATASAYSDKGISSRGRNGW
jgi:hypothetical protein